MRIEGARDRPEEAKHQENGTVGRYQIRVTRSDEVNRMRNEA